MVCVNCGRKIENKSVFCNWCGARQARREVNVPAPRQLKSGRWNIELRAEGQSVTEDTPEQATAKAVAIREGFADKKQKKDSRTVGEAIDAYISNRTNVLSPSTIDGYKRIRRLRMPSIMDMKVSSITDEIMQKAVNDAAKTLKRKTLVNTLGLIEPAVGRCFDVTLPGEEEHESPVYSSEQLATLLRAIDGKGEIECAVLLALWLSFRRSEILALRPEDVLDNAIKVHNARVYDENHKLVEKTTKTKKSTRIVLCPDYIIVRLRRLPQTGEYLFTHGTHYFWESLTKICERNNLPHIYLHGLRHMNATVMGMLGIDTKYAMKRGGWSSERTMRNVYQGLMTEAEQNTAAKIDGYFLSLIG